MPWIDPTEVFAKPPRLDDQTADLEDWSGEVESGSDGGLVEGYVITGARLTRSPPTAWRSSTRNCPESTSEPIIETLWIYADPCSGTVI